MSTLQEQAFATLVAANTDAGARVYPLVAPDNPTLPYVVYLRIHDTPSNILNGPPPIDNTHLQVDICSRTYVGAQQLGNQVQAALQAAVFSAILISENEHFDPDVKLYRIVQEYSIWSA